MNINIKPVSQFAKGVVTRIKTGLSNRKKAQTNFKNRKDNTNYYEGTSYWKDHTN